MPTADQVRAAINALYRVRAVEKAPEADGTREIWHQSATGADLLSVLNAEGKLTQQQLTLFSDVIHWSPRGGLRSGRVHDPSDGEPISGDGTLFDPALSSERLKRAHDAISAYEGKDGYLIHLRDVLAAALQGRQWSEQRIISRVSDSQPIRVPGISRSTQAALIAVGAAVVLLAAAAAWLLIR
jgi:hypothetical protein